MSLMEKMYQKGVAAERERITKLLEAASAEWLKTDYDSHYGAESCLELIKGEQA